jgi:hypothetical protein
VGATLVVAVACAVELVALADSDVGVDVVVLEQPVIASIPADNNAAVARVGDAFVNGGPSFRFSAGRAPVDAPANILNWDILPVKVR